MMYDYDDGMETEWNRSPRPEKLVLAGSRRKPVSLDPTRHLVNGAATEMAMLIDTCMIPRAVWLFYFVRKFPPRKRLDNLSS